jgi:hypothetical protein
MAAPELALAEAHRVLRADGRLACTVWAPDESAGRVRAGLRRAGRAAGRAGGAPAMPLDAAESAELLALLADRGLVDVEL